MLESTVDVIFVVTFGKSSDSNYKYIYGSQAFVTQKDNWFTQQWLKLVKPIGMTFN